jgi:hypothetical protein
MHTSAEVFSQTPMPRPQARVRTLRLKHMVMNMHMDTRQLAMFGAAFFFRSLGLLSTGVNRTSTEGHARAATRLLLIVKYAN